MKRNRLLLIAAISILSSGSALNAQAPLKAKKMAEFGQKDPTEIARGNGIDRCSTDEYEKFLKDNFPNRSTKEEFEAWLAPLIEKAKNEKSQNGNIITIPVVVHVIHSGQNYGTAPNIVDEQVESQITVMNNDFRRITGTPGFNSNVLGADTEVQFALAKVDPYGNPTNGINRVNLCSVSWSQTDINSNVKPSTIWDPTQYMNMWSVRFSSASLLGYAQFPSNSGLGGLNTNGGEAYTDGVVANYATFGSSDYNVGNSFILSAPYDKGRTMTHEVGHYLGLRHIWGDSSSCVVNATDSYNDYCLDTPAAAAANYNCVTIDTCPGDPGNDMVQNYMDYTNDTCMNIYTINQKDRIRAVMNNSIRRAELKTSNKDVAIPLFANDAEVKLERECNTVTCSSSAISPKISLYNRGTSTMTSAVISYTINGLTQTYNWTGSLAPNKYSIVTLPVAANTLGGQMNINVTSVNGVADQRSSNSNINVNYLGAPVRVDPTVVLNLQLDFYGSETSWTLKDSSGATVYSSPTYGDSSSLPAPLQYTFNLNPNECYTFTINDSYGDGLYPYGGYYNFSTTGGTVITTGNHFPSSQTRLLKVQTLGTKEAVKQTFGIYPNPATDVINVTKASEKATFELHNAAGQLVKGGNIIKNQVQVSELVKGTYVITIKDKEVSEKIKFIKK